MFWRKRQIEKSNIDTLLRNIISLAILLKVDPEKLLRTSCDEQAIIDYVTKLNEQLTKLILEKSEKEGK